MKKIIIRKRFQRCVGSQYIMLAEAQDYKTMEDLLQEYGRNKVMKEIYGEEYDTFHDLREEYFSLKKKLESGADCKSTDNFYIAYRLNKKYAVEIEDHITLFHLEEPLVIGGKELVPWMVAAGDMYYGDPWWAKDEEILRDLLNMNTIQFMEEYKGF